VELQLSDGAIISAKLMLRSLMSEGPAIPRAEMERFYNLVLAEYDGELSEKIAGTMDDPYYNALQAKYAYCVTCHKAQGGQWKHIYIDMGGIDWSNPEPAYFRWLYTALTRSTEKVFLINPTIPCK
jgi:exodeoxyribonuclease-5